MAYAFAIIMRFSGIQLFLKNDLFILPGLVQTRDDGLPGPGQQAAFYGILSETGIRMC
jgi:hypothetical protein